MTRKGPAPRQLDERFWEKVDDSGGSDACWPWKAKATARGGYGAFAIRRSTMIGAHQLAFELGTGQMFPEGGLVMHSCDNPPCCNPRHLSLGTNLLNIRDAAAKGRMHPGEEHGLAKLTDERVREARARLARGESRQSIGDSFGVSRACIGKIEKGLTWRHVG